MRAIGTLGGSSGSASSFSTPIHSDWISFGRDSFSSVPGAGLAISATSIDASGWSVKRSAGSARRSSGSQSSGFSVSLAKRIFTGGRMVASALA